MDHLCGAILMAHYLGKKGTLHGLTLPRSWLSRLVGDLEHLAHMRTNQSSSYTDNLERLLGAICTGSDAGTFRDCARLTNSKLTLRTRPPAMGEHGHVGVQAGKSYSCRVCRADVSFPIFLVHLDHPLNHLWPSKMPESILL